MNKGIVCLVCGKCITDRRVFAMHHAKQHAKTPIDKERLIVYSLYGKEKVDALVKDYIEEKISVFGMLPIDISKYLKLLGVKRTSHQERQTKRYKEKYQKAIQEKYGEEITNISQVREVQQKKELSFSKSYGSYGTYLAECRKKMKEGYDEFCNDENKKGERYRKTTQTLRARYGVDNPAQIEESRKSISQKAQERMDVKSKEEKRFITKNARESVPHHWAKTTKLEQIVISGIKQLGYEPQMHIRVGRYSIDIVLDNYAIEVQGDIYHANPRMFNAEDEVLQGTIAKDVWERDARKKKAIEEAGYNYVCLWEDEIRANRCHIASFLDEEIFNRKERK